jgi:signal transduction histidine kinase
VLRIADSGRGFDLGVAANNGGLGLVGMRERLRPNCGELTIRSRPGFGTTIEARVPITHALAARTGNSMRVA